VCSSRASASHIYCVGKAENNGHIYRDRNVQRQDYNEVVNDWKVRLITRKTRICSLELNRYIDIEHSITLDILTTKLAALSGEGELESHLTLDDNHYHPSPTYDVRCGRKTPGSAGSIVTITKSLERIESRMSDWIGLQDSGNYLHDSRSGSGGGIGSNRISYLLRYIGRASHA
jgi:hypothetical protein